MLFTRLTTVFTITLSFFFREKGEMLTLFPSTERFTLTLSKCFFASPSLPFIERVLPARVAVTPGGSSTTCCCTCSVDKADQSPADLLLLRLHVSHDALGRGNDQS